MLKILRLPPSALASTPESSEASACAVGVDSLGGCTPRETYPADDILQKRMMLNEPKPSSPTKFYEKHEPQTGKGRRA
jgi:hypothetical protein